jgi:hypothetical protein
MLNLKMLNLFRFIIQFREQGTGNREQARRRYLSITNPQSPIPSPQSPVPSPQLN